MKMTSLLAGLGMKTKTSESKSRVLQIQHIQRNNPSIMTNKSGNFHISFLLIFWNKSEHKYRFSAGF